MRDNLLRPLAGIVAMALCGLLIAGAVQSFRGAFADTVAVQVLSPRAGLVMNPDADVKMRGVTVGAVTAIRERPDGLAALELAIDTGALARIPGNVSVAIASTTVFGAKFVQLVPPARPEGRLRAGQVLTADRVTVEINTVFEQLTAVLSALEPEKLNTTLGAVAAATRGRGDQVGQMLTDLEAFLAELEPALPALRTDLTLAAPVLATYADAAQPLLDTAGHVTALGGTLLEEQQHLDAVLPALIGLADTGDRVLAANADALAATLDVLVPTTALTAEYREALYCSLDGFADLSQMPPVNVPGLGLSANFLWGIDPYRYPDNLPKLEASGGSQCSVLPVGYEQRPPFVVADVGANPFARGNQGILVNPENLPNALFGPPTEASR